MLYRGMAVVECLSNSRDQQLLWVVRPERAAGPWVLDYLCGNIMNVE